MIKATIIADGYWEKGQDFIDGSPRYRLLVRGSIEGSGRYCDSFDSPLRWHAVVVTERESAYPGGPKKNAYYAAVEDCRLEKRWENGPIWKVKDARRWAEETAISVIGEATP